MGRRTAPAATLEEIATSPLFHGVGESDIRAAVEAGQTIEVDEGAIVIAADVENRLAYLVLSGSLNVYLAPITAEPIALAKPGDLIGEMSFLAGGARSASVVAGERSRLLVIDEKEFWQLIHNSHAFAVNLLRMLAQRLRYNNDSVVRNADLRSKYEHEATFDTLTGIHNRRWFDDALERLVARWQPSAPACLLSLDIDFFKRVNDTYGHPAGDRVLRSVSDALVSGLRPTDISARIGGEEFAIIVPDTSIEVAAMVAERLRERIGCNAIVLEGSKEVSVTVSIGVACLRPGQTAAAFYEAADRALYQAKQLGRNRVVVAPI